MVCCIICEASRSVEVDKQIAANAGQLQSHFVHNKCTDADFREGQKWLLIESIRVITHYKNSFQKSLKKSKNRKKIRRGFKVLESNVMVTSELFHNYFSLRRRPSEIILFQRVETCLKLF